MKAIFVTSLVGASTSLFGIFELSAITIIPSHGSERWRGQMMLIVGIFLVGWLCTAFWVRPRQHPVLPPRWLGRLLVFIGIVYTLVTLIFVLG